MKESTDQLAIPRFCMKRMPAAFGSFLVNPGKLCETSGLQVVQEFFLRHWSQLINAN